MLTMEHKIIDIDYIYTRFLKNTEVYNNNKNLIRLG